MRAITFDTGYSENLSGIVEVSLLNISEDVGHLRLTYPMFPICHAVTGLSSHPARHHIVSLLLFQNRHCLLSGMACPTEQPQRISM